MAVLSLPSREAGATPFTLPPQRLAVDLGMTFDQARSQWTVTGDHGVFPLNGTFVAQSVQLGIRYGIIEGLEAQAHAAYKVVNYNSDPLHLFNTSSGLSAGALSDQIINLNRQDSGFGDVYAGLSYRPIKRYVNFAGELEVKIPTGYRAPTGTFCQDLAPGDAKSKVAQMAQNPALGLIRPQDFCTGATLGSGQVDLLFLLELGKYIPLTRTFFRLEAGMDFRFAGPGQQFVGSAKVGESIRDVVVLYLSGRVGYTVNTGATVGTTLDSANPGAPTDSYPGNLLLFHAATLDYSFVFIDAGAIVRVLPTLELRASYSRALWGINFPELNSVSVGLAVVAL